MNELPLGVSRVVPDATANGAACATADELGRVTERAALELGFARIGFAPVAPLEDARIRLQRFRESGFAAGMQYLQSGDRHDPKLLLPEARTAVVVALAYGEPGLVSLRRSKGELVGEVARYARGQDYHQVLRTKLHRLAKRIASAWGAPLLARACVDTAPLLERDLARAAGLGFLAKSTLLIAPGVGSYVLLGELLVDVEIAAPLETRRSVDGCGKCRACLDACPTQAFVGPHVLDARRCISYLTIEFDGVIPLDLRAPMGMRVFGCDVCQEVCPFNASPRPRPVVPELAPSPRLDGIDLIGLLSLGSAGYRKLVGKSALRRATRTTLRRNAAIALGNSGDPRAVAPLVTALQSDAPDVVRLHAAWALGELRAHLDDDARRALELAARDAHDGVAEEARLALSRLEPRPLARASTGAADTARTPG